MTFIISNSFTSFLVFIIIDENYYSIVLVLYYELDFIEVILLISLSFST